MSDETEEELADAAPQPAGRVATIVVAVVFAVLYGYALLQAVSNLIALPDVYAQLGINGSVPWPLLVVGVVIPPVLFVVAVLLGRGRTLTNRALILAAGLGATNAIFLSLVTLVGAFQPAIAS